MNINALRTILKAGSSVFGLSALFLLIFPRTFLDLLQLEASDGMIWSMRMIGITLIALVGNMWNNAGQRNDQRVASVARIMCVRP